MKTVLSKKILISSAVLILALTGCVETGRSTAPAAGNAKCPWAADDSVKGTVRIAYQKVPNGDPIVKDQGILEACMPNATIKWSVFTSGADVLQAYGANSIDVGYIGSSPVTMALSEPLKMPISVVWMFDVIGNAESLVVRDDAIKSVSELKGKTIAVPFSSTSHFALLQALKQAGIDSRNDVKLVNLSPAQMTAAWQGGQIDAAWVWSPVLDELGATGHLISDNGKVATAGTATYDLGTARTAFVKENPAFMTQWTKAQDYAVKMISENPDKAAQSIAVELGINPKDAVKQFTGFRYLRATEQVADDAMGKKLGKDLAATADFLLIQGSIQAVSAPEVYADAVDSSFAKTAR
ncbi:ABC transporter substrate-binding protein [Pseudarthrobacter sp. H2]|uniref:taurine ABC transporter substrate-binding protein n=1 Tax=Pseudarthrobacter sp. H2 TaxID=3418415 RepID=UPI003CEA96EB